MEQTHQDTRTDKTDHTPAHTPNALTIAAIREGRQLAYCKAVKGFTNIDDLKAALQNDDVS